MGKNGNLRILLLELILTDQKADLPNPPVEASRGKEWQFEISTVTAHIGRSTGRSTHPQLEASSEQQW